MSHNSSTSYSYWSSLLNQTTHIAWLPNHFLYSVTLDTKGLIISRLSTRVPFRKPQPTSIKMSHFILLSHFISWTIDRPISLSLSQNQPEGLIINILQENILIQRTFSLKGVDVTIVIPDNHVHLLISNRCEQTQF
jgi:hypothetical protein